MEKETTEASNLFEIDREREHPQIDGQRKLDLR